MSELMPLNNLNAIEVFQEGGLDPLLKAIREEATSFVPDISTEKGRGEIKSMAYKVARSKTAIDDVGKSLVSDWKSKSKVVDAERKRARDECDSIRDEVRKPLDEWEQAEEERVQGHMQIIGYVQDDGNESIEGYLDIDLDAMIEKRNEIQDIDPDQFEEFAERMEEVKLIALTKINMAIEKRQKHDADQADLEKLRQQAAEREQKEAEERAEKARKEREEQIRIEAAEKEKRAAQEREEALEREKQEAHDAKIRAEEQAAAAEKRAKEAEALAKQQAAEEQARIKQREADEIARRERNKQHKGKIHREIMEGIEKAGNLSPTTSKKIVTAMAKGEIPHITINY